MPRVGRVPLSPYWRPIVVQRRFTHRAFERGGSGMKMKSITAKGSRIEQLKELAKVLATAIAMSA